MVKRRKVAKARKVVRAVKIAIPALRKGEHYAGLILTERGKPDYHLIVMSEKLGSANWQASMDWAKQNGGDLPSRRDLNLEYANAKHLLQSAYYWSNETHASDPSYAWMQHFGNGDQDCSRKGNDYRARAVRRVKV